MLELGPVMQNLTETKQKAHSIKPYLNEFFQLEQNFSSILQQTKKD